MLHGQWLLWDWFKAAIQIVHSLSRSGHICYRHTMGIIIVPRYTQSMERDSSKRQSNPKIETRSYAVYFRISLQLIGLQRGIVNSRCFVFFGCSHVPFLNKIPSCITVYFCKFTCMYELNAEFFTMLETQVLFTILLVIWWMWGHGCIFGHGDVMFEYQHIWLWMFTMFPCDAFQFSWLFSC